MAALMALLTYYIALFTTPTPRIAFLVAISSSPRLTNVYKSVKWLLRVVFRQGSEIQRVLGGGSPATGYIRLPEDEPSTSSSNPVDSSDRVPSSPIKVNSNAIATWGIDHALLQSRHLEAPRETLATLDAKSLTSQVTKSKQIYPSPEVQERLQDHLKKISSVHRASAEIVQRSQETYSADRGADVANLRELWQLLQPEGAGLPENMQTKQWQDLGFQGKDPSTDWRSVGLLGLDSMLYFAKNTQNARQLVVEAVKPAGTNTLGWYPFALAYITITDFALRLLKLGSLSWLLLSSSASVEDTFLRIVSLLVQHFHMHWQYLQKSEHPQEASRARPVVMDFERIVKKWKIEVTRWVERGRIAGWVDSRGFVEEVWTRFDIRKGKSSTSDAQRSRAEL